MFFAFFTFVNIVKNYFIDIVRIVNREHTE